MQNTTQGIVNMNLQKGCMDFQYNLQKYPQYAIGIIHNDMSNRCGKSPNNSKPIVAHIILKNMIEKLNTTFDFFPIKTEMLYTTPNITAV